jgi:membrane protein DedA with SNARE-associated domain
MTSAIDLILHLEPLPLYAALFAGLVVLGGFVLLPALFLAIVGSIKLSHLFAVVILASVCSDSLWYLIGRKVKKERLYSMRFLKHRVEEAARFSAFFSKHGALLVFLTKFVYGTRIASHLLAGMHRISFAWFLLAVSAGTAVWFWILYFLIRSLDLGISAVKDTALRMQILFALAALFLIFVNWFTGKYIRRRMYSLKKR